ncbi:hypothetical protein F4825DRAFT_428214 [Nemania diffusa]|nr:hypothetical protein F4825DRAFT_428214 [Nemania diffusa]
MADQTKGANVKVYDNEKQVPVVESRAELASRYAAFEENLTIWQTIGIYWKSTFWVTYGLAVVFGYGLDGTIAGNLVAIPKFREDYGEKHITDGVTTYIIPATWLAVFSGASQICAIIGAFGAGWLADLIGRKYTTLLSCVISVAAVSAQYESNGSLIIFAVGKGLNGFPVGMWLVLGPLYASEVAALKLRGVLVSMTNFVLTTAVLVISAATYGLASNTMDYRILLSCQWVVPGIVLLTIPMWPESPVWLVRMGKRDAAIRSIRRLYGNNKRIDGEGLLAQIEESVADEKCRSQGTYRECFTAAERKRTMICMFVYACQSFSGAVPIGAYQCYLFELLGYSTPDSLLLGMLNIVAQFLASIGSWFLIPTVEHRDLIVWGQLAAAISLFIAGGASASTSHVAHQLTIAFIFIWVSVPFSPISSSMNTAVFLPMGYLFCFPIHFQSRCRESTGKDSSCFCGNNNYRLYRGVFLYAEDEERLKDQN